MRLLQNFGSQVQGLFNNSLNNFKITIQSVFVLNNTKVSSDGTYTLPVGVDKTWFTIIQKKQTVENILNKVNNVIVAGSYAATANVVWTNVK